MATSLGKENESGCGYGDDFTFFRFGVRVLVCGDVIPYLPWPGRVVVTVAPVRRSEGRVGRIVQKKFHSAREGREAGREWGRGRGERECVCEGWLCPNPGLEPQRKAPD
jgi:hypothetical protein